jgi:hypothetical protein
MSDMSTQQVSRSSVILLIMLASVMPAGVFAQTSDASTTPVEVTQTAPTQTVVIVDSAAVSILADTVQNATSTQATIPADVLVQTADPSTFDSGNASSTVPIDVATTTPVIVPTTPVSATSTPETPAIPLKPDTTSSTTTAPVILKQSTADVVPMPQDIAAEDATSTSPDVVATMPVTAIAAKKSFTFSIRAERIATEKVPQWQRHGDAARKKDGKKDAQASVADQSQPAPNVVPDPISGIPVVSGNCSKAYYVILLYKNQTDYDSDPASYAVNKAYPCVNGTYQFEMKDLPQSISDGTYYLLIGEMGETGSWLPVTSLVPIDIVR